MHKLVITSERVQLYAYEEPVPATIEISDTGKISNVILRKSSQSDYQTTAVEFMDLRDLVVLPGLVDPHVHLNEPGRTEWEGFYTGTKAAISGGTTTVVDMPLNSIPPTTKASHLSLKKEAAKGQCWSDVAFWGGVIPNNDDELIPLLKSGVKGFKCFLIDSGVEEFPPVTEEDVRKVMGVLKDTDTVLQFHAELNNKAQEKDKQRQDPTLYETFLTSRPDTMELTAISLVVSLSRLYPALRTHIVHLSSASAIPLLKDAKATLPVTVETCYHYLCLDSSIIHAGHLQFKCCPPIRSKENREALWQALKDGIIDFVVSDHSPCISSLKCLDTGNFMEAWGGISGLGLGLSLLWTEGLKRGISFRNVVEWLSERPARHAGLSSRKGRIDIGYDADFAIFNPSERFIVTDDYLHFKNRISPYKDAHLSGRVVKTILRGRMVYDSDSADKFPPNATGQML